MRVGDRRQPTPNPSQEGKTGDRRQPTPRPSPSQEGRHGNERGGRSKNCKNDFSAQL
ncbi:MULTISPECIES: hypothetical protein [Okeania]|uniref:hypothetical protein n=1 Tax=Okeania TaxID=1458928 RepID=UPI001374CE92|nr:MULTISPECIES: hypothetical protein [Okeania]NET14884.1 hypothetical protein [Okeania sp. SIO1H6]NES77994.1 hypothetical protein [Okeania sp. SIO1H4]NES89244.1 hypothetical protein [Okeania sp. SIO2B9]NET21849.1 hypothetical protein [Okeania sp. SIO1H5]NET80256.1 hypothetical protein [Okeania sp. SIO1F9]